MSAGLFKYDPNEVSINHEMQALSDDKQQPVVDAPVPLTLTQANLKLGAIEQQLDKVAAMRSQSLFQGDNNGLDPLADLAAHVKECNRQIASIHSDSDAEQPSSAAASS